MNPVASRGFRLGADAYEKGRPEYSDDAVDYLLRELNVSSSTTALVDLAAGTGKFTKHLVVKTHASATMVVAIEPVAAMRSKFHETLPSTTQIAGLAESI